MLIYADIEQLNEIAKRYQCTCSSYSKHELIQSILDHSYRDDITEMQLHSMSEQQKHLLSILLFEEHKKYSTEELKAKIKYCKFVEKQEKSKRKKALSTQSLEEKIIKQLKDEGWLFKEQGFTNHPLYQIPADKSESFRRSLALEIKAKLDSYNDVHIVRNEAGYILEDIKIMLQFISSKVIPINELKLMNKRTLQQLLSSLYVNEVIPGKGAWKFGYGKKFGEYPDRFALVYQFSVQNGWINELDYLQLSEQGMEKALLCDEHDNIKLIDYWLSIYKKPIPNIRALSYFILTALDEWRSVEQLQKVLHPYIKAYYFDNEEAILQKRMLKMLLHFGVIMLGQKEHNHLMVKLTPYGMKWLMQALKLNEQGKFIKRSE